MLKFMNEYFERVESVIKWIMYFLHKSYNTQHVILRWIKRRRSSLMWKGLQVQFVPNWSISLSESGLLIANLEAYGLNMSWKLQSNLI